MRLGIDMDGVCADWTHGARRALNKRFDLGLDEEKESEHWDSIMDSISKKQWQWLWTGGVDQGLFRTLRPVPGTHRALMMLSQNHEIHLLTDRPVAARFHTLQWIVENLPGLNVSSLRFGKEKWIEECDIYLDDKPENILSIAANRPAATPVVRTRLYNLDMEWPFRVNHWLDFVQFVEQRSDNGR